MYTIDNKLKEGFKKQTIESILSGKEYEEVLKAIGNRKMIAFGASEIADDILKHFPQKVSYYVDNDSTRWNDELNGTPILNPNKLLEEKEEIAIIITSVHFDAIAEQIENLGICKYIVINSIKLLARHRACFNFEKRKLKYEDFINRMPTLEEFNKENNYKNEKNKSDEKPIGIIISNHVFFYTPFYDLVLAGLLRYQGYNVVIIWDNVNEFSDMLLDWKGASRYQDEELKSCIQLISEKLNIEVINVNGLDEQPLDEMDIKEIERLSEQSLIAKYHRSFMSEDLLKYKKDYVKKFSYNLRKIKSILDKREFKRLVTDAGLIYYASLYMWLGKKEGFDVAAKDMAFRYGGFMSTNGPSNHMMDIKMVLEENLLDENVERKITDLGRKEFEESIMRKGEIVYGICQEVSYDEDNSKEEFDVIIPLNMAWDGAALGKNNLFLNIGDCLVETITYILNYTKATVAVRQHPKEKNMKVVNDFFLMYSDVEEKYKSGEDLFIKLNNKFGDNERFKYIRSDEKINTYRLIEKAKLVLPHTSTTGLEAAIMGKNVIVENDVYYGAISAIKNVYSKDEYFDNIQKYCKEKSSLNADDIGRAQFAYGLLKLNNLKIDFIQDSDIWLDTNIMDLFKEKEVIYVIKALGEGIPIVVSRAEDLFK